MKKNTTTIIIALVFTLSVIALGYVMLGLLPMFLFAFGFLGGFFIWVFIPDRVAFKSIKIPFWLTLILFVFHKMEERYMDFFPRLADITGVPVPETDSILVYLLYAMAGAWLLIPFLMKRQSGFGYYLAWTFFTSMGITEIAHFVFPLFTDKANGYFPGMATALLLAPLGWWGMHRLSGRTPKERSSRLT